MVGARGIAPKNYARDAGHVRPDRLGARVALALDMNQAMLDAARRDHALHSVGVFALLLPMSCASVAASSSQGDSGAPPSAAADAAASVGSGAGSTQGSDPPPSCQGDAAASDTVTVPAGNFLIGCNATVDTDCRDDERPLHTVSLGAFKIERTEVSQDQYATCVSAGACTAPSCTWDCAQGDHPAGCVEWAQAKAYCAWAGRRLPTEAEWEAAARGSDGRKYPWGNDEPDCTRAKMSGCGAVSDSVGQHPTGASPYGALDMAGNVVEMVADWYESTYYQDSGTVDPTGPQTGKRYGGRGGGYLSTAVWLRASARDVYDTTDAFISLGFRC